MFSKLIEDPAHEMKFVLDLIAFHTQHVLYVLYTVFLDDKGRAYLTAHIAFDVFYWNYSENKCRQDIPYNLECLKSN